MRHGISLVTALVGLVVHRRALACVGCRLSGDRPSGASNTDHRLATHSRWPTPSAIRATRWGRSIWVALLIAGCAPSTRVAVRNESSAPLSVVLRTAESQSAMRFSDIAPRSASPLFEAQLSSLQSVVVEVRDGEAESGRIDLRGGEDNIVIVRLGEPPLVLIPGEPPQAPTPPPSAPDEEPAVEAPPVAPAPTPPHPDEPERPYEPHEPDEPDDGSPEPPPSPRPI